MKKPLLFIMLSAEVIMFFSCNFNKQNETDNLFSDTLISKDIPITKEIVKELIKTIPNPVILSSTIEKVGASFSEELLNPTANSKKYKTNYKKALNLGVYGTDLVHMNTYDRTTSTIVYLMAIKDIANDLKIGQFFNYKTLIRLSENNKNIDSTLFITNKGYDDMNNFLQEQNRTNISALITLGIWIETLYLAVNVKELAIYSKNYTNIPELTPSAKKIIYNRIGEQKIVLDNICMLLTMFKDDEDFKDLIKDMELLKNKFKKVDIVYNYKEPTTKEVNGELIVIDNSSSFVNMNDTTLENIAKTTTLIRNKIIN